MRQKTFNTILLFYALTLLTAYTLLMIYLLNFSSDINQFYNILITFDRSILYKYIYNIIQIILNMIAVIPIFLTVYKKYFLPDFVWQVHFILRVVFEIIGHPYEMGQWIALTYLSPLAAVLTLLSFLFFFGPSYVIGYEYSFKRKDFLRK